jgi:hypothetical protein
MYARARDVNLTLHCVEWGKRIGGRPLLLPKSGLVPVGGWEISPTGKRLLIVVSSASVYGDAAEG